MIGDELHLNKNIYVLIKFQESPGDQLFVALRQYYITEMMKHLDDYGQLKYFACQDLLINNIRKVASSILAPRRNATFELCMRERYK